MSWCPTSTSLLVGAGQKCAIYSLSTGEHNRWKAVCDLETSGIVKSVAWAPNLGRKYEWLAAATTTGLYIFKYSGEEVVKGVKLCDSVEKCEWNVTGSVLASTGSSVKLWKQTFLDEWKLLTTVSAE